MSKLLQLEVLLIPKEWYQVAILSCPSPPPWTTCLIVTLSYNTSRIAQKMCFSLKFLIHHNLTLCNLMHAPSFGPLPFMLDIYGVSLWKLWFYINGGRREPRLTKCLEEVVYSNIRKEFGKWNVMYVVVLTMLPVRNCSIKNFPKMLVYAFLSYYFPV